MYYNKDYCNKCALKIFVIPKHLERCKTKEWKLKQSLLRKGKKQYLIRKKYQGRKTYTNRGYIQIEHEGKIRGEHCVVMEEYLGRKLKKDEIVHHINNDKKDNRLENLYLLKRSTHVQLHKQQLDLFSNFFNLGIFGFKEGKYFINNLDFFNKTFDDFLLLPQFNTINSRLDVDISTNISRNIKIDIPICSTNMSSITELDMMIAMNSCGGASFLHRFLPIKEQKNIIKKAKLMKIFPIIPSIGVKQKDFKNIDVFIDLDVDAILIDIAHGHSSSVFKIVEYIKEKTDKIDVIVGNIATSDAVFDFYRLGVDGLRVGIGGGSQCKTREKTGHGCPTLSSIISCSSFAKKFNIPVIADGGFKKTSDIVKGLAFGANCVCLGGMLAGTDSTPGDIVEKKNTKYKEFFGMASEFAQVKYKGGLKCGTCSEGSYSLIEFKGKTKDVINDIIGAIRSGLTYSGSFTIEELQEKKKFISISENSAIESKYIKN